MQSLIQEFSRFDVGYSDHTLGTTACICAAALGARVLEKHFTCDKNAEGPDHQLSANPSEMKAIVDGVRTFEVMRGDGIKCPAISEKTTRLNNRKSLVLNMSVQIGESLTRDHLAIKRPGTGIAPKFFDEVLGRVVCKDLKADDILTWEDLR